jgi:hypothetical protein
MMSPSESVHVSIGEKELLASETFIALTNNETVVRLKHQGEQLSLVLVFEDSPDGKDAQTAFETISKQALRIRMKDFKNPLGAFVKSPLEIGTIGGRRLWLVYFVAHLQGADLKRVTLTFYVGAKAHG